MSDRGEYRSCFVAMADDPDIQAMPGDVFKLFWMLKLTLPTAGIGIVYPGMLCDQVGCSREELEAMFRALEAPKAGAAHGWILRDGNLVWLIRALECEPGMKPNSPNHRKNVLKAVNRLSPRSSVVQAFRERYAEWFTPAPKTSLGDIKGFQEGSENGSQKGSEGVADSTQNPHSTEQHKGEALDLDHPAAGGADDGSADGAGIETASPAAQEGGNGRAPLPHHAQRVLRERYGVPKRATWAALTDRQKQIARDMRATLDGVGAVLEKGVRVRAFDVDHLDEACAHVLAKELTNPDAAFRHVLLFLRDTYHERRTAAEKASFGEGEDRARGPTSTPPERAGGVIGEIGRRLLLRPTNADEIAAANAWLAEQPEERRAELAAAVDRALPANRNAPSTRAQLLSDATVDAYRRAVLETAGAA